jgi:hypothetical protein
LIYGSQINNSLPRSTVKNIGMVKKKVNEINKMVGESIPNKRTIVVIQVMRIVATKNKLIFL